MKHRCARLVLSHVPGTVTMADGLMIVPRLCALFSGAMEEPAKVCEVP